MRARFLARSCTVLLLFVAACSDSSSAGGEDTGARDAGSQDGQVAADAAQPGDGAASDAEGTKPPGRFTLSEPQDGDSDVSRTPTLRWASARDAVSYTAEIATDPGFGAADLVHTTTVTEPSWTLSAPLEPGILYYWRVLANNSAGDTNAENGPAWFSCPVAVGSNPHGIAVTADGATAVVSNAGNPGAVTFVQLSTFSTETLSFAGQASSQPGMVAITPDGTTALVAQLNNVIFVNLANRQVSGSFVSPCAATTLYGIAVKPDGSAAVLPDFNAGCVNDVVNIVSLPGGALGNAYPLGTSATAFGVAITPDGASALITRGITATSMRRIGLNDGALTSIVNTSSTYGVAITADGASALASSGPGDTVKIISLTTNAVTGSIDYASNTDVGNIAITPDGQTALVAGDLDLAILDVAGRSVVRRLPGAARSVAITPDGKRGLFTGAGAEGKLHVVKLR